MQLEGSNSFGRRNVLNGVLATRVHATTVRAGEPKFLPRAGRRDSSGDAGRGYDCAAMSGRILDILGAADA